MASLAEKLAESKVAGSRRRQNNADRKREELRNEYWPGSVDWIWSIHDKKGVVGFATVSRLMPWIMHLIKIVAKIRNKPDPSPAYLELWCRDFGQGIISIKDEEECAYAAGYSSNRSIRTWREQMLLLIDLGFIMAKAEGNREYGQILLLNPLAVCARLRNENKVPDEWWTSFVRRAKEISAEIPLPLDMSIKPVPAVEAEAATKP